MSDSPALAEASPTQTADYLETRRRTPRVAMNFTVEIFGKGTDGVAYTLKAVSQKISPGGGSFALEGDASILAQLEKGQRVVVETSFGSLSAEINGLWTEPKEPQPGASSRPYIGLRLLEGMTWIPTTELN